MSTSPVGDLTGESAPAPQYRVLLSVRGGLHAGVAYVADTGRAATVGRASHCDLVLMDAGVAPEALRLSVVAGTLVAEVLGEPVLHGGVALPRGRVAFDEPSVRLQLGTASLQVEVLRRSSQARPGVSGPPVGLGPEAFAADRGVSGACHRADGAARAGSAGTALPAPTRVAPSRRGGSALMVGAVAAVVLAAGGAAVSASYRSAAPSAAPPALAAVVSGFNERGAALSLAERGAGTPLVRGLVEDVAMRAELERALAATGLRPSLQVQDVRAATESLDRLARLAGHDCAARHLGGGRFACGEALPDAASADRFRTLAASVPGVLGLALESRPPPQVVQAEPPAPEPVVVPPAPVRLSPPHPQIRHVAIGPGGGLAIDVRGRTLRVGDRVDGARVVAVRFNGLDLVYEGERYSVGVNAALGDAEPVAH